MELFLHYSLIPSFFIILVLSFLQRREQQRERDDTYLLRNRFGMIVPLDFVGTFSNRWSYGVAFGATANKVMFLFSEGYQPLRVPQWAQGTRAASHLLGISPRKFLLRGGMAGVLWGQGTHFVDCQHSFQLITYPRSMLSPQSFKAHLSAFSPS